MQNDPIIEGRSCDGCTKCCEGAVGVEIRGIEIFQKGCPFVDRGVGCTIYHAPDIRDNSVCSNYKCDYLTNPDVPEEFKPSITNVLIETYPSSDKGTYLRVLETGKDSDIEVLEWAKDYAKEKGLNIIWQFPSIKEYGRSEGLAGKKNF